LLPIEIALEDSFNEFRILFFEAVINVGRNEVVPNQHY
jgi:hypothetical protein